MVDFATLVLAADSRGLLSGEQALDSLANTAERTENRVNKANDNVSKGMQQVGKQSIMASQQTRMAAMQLSQVAQQASATGNWVQALAIQLPDLTLGFGTVGIAAGVVAGALLPLIANMVTSGDKAKELEDAFENLDSAMQGYREAVENSLLPAGELIEKFGGQAEGAERVYEAMRKIKELEFQEAMTAARDAIAGSLEEIAQAVERYDFASTNFAHADAIAAVRTQVALLENQYGLTLIQATRINDALDEMGSATSPGELAQAAMRLGDELARATDEGAKLSPELREVQKNAYQASLDAAEFARLTGAAIGPANSLASAVSGVADQYARAAEYAAYLTSRHPSQGAYSGVERSADGPIQGESFPLPERGPTPGSRPLIELDGLPGQFGGRRKGRGPKTQAELYEDLIKTTERRIASLNAERAAVGLTEQEADKLLNTTELLNDASQKGIELTDPQRAKLESLADTMSRVAEETRKAQEQADFYNDMQDDLKKGFIDAIVEGESLIDVFEDLAKSIEKAALEAALFGSGPMSGGISGGGLLGGLLSSVFGGVGGGSASLPSIGPVPTPRPLSFDGGGYTGNGTRSGGEDGKGGFWALLHPYETVIDHTKGGAFSAGGGSETGRTIIQVSLSPDLLARVLEEAKGQSIEIVRQNNAARQNIQQNGGTV
ncbi:UNVERIFIED_ORG: hypothetical protein J2W19_003127 [Shinella zoogloeoides]|nr:hypothetical protein [Shinella zoogloeoides]